MTARKTLSKLVLFKKREISEQSGWSWSKEARMERSIIVWFSEEKICDMKMFSLVFAQDTYIGLICQSVNSIMHETVVKDPGKN